RCSRTAGNTIPRAAAACRRTARGRDGRCARSSRSRLRRRCAGRRRRTPTRRGRPAAGRSTSIPSGRVLRARPAGARARPSAPAAAPWSGRPVRCPAPPLPPTGNRPLACDGDDSAVALARHPALRLGSVPMSAAMAAEPSPAAGPVRPLRIAMASFIGTAVEWYDYFIYGTAAAIVFGPLFFPKFSATAGTMAAFATFSVGFLARPLGAMVMGHFGDRLGRKSMLVVSLLTIGVATTCIGLLPTYASVGVLAPALLVGLRFLQGIGVGGEWGGAVLLAVEHAPANRKGFNGSFPQMGVPGGLILANLVFLAVSSAVGRDAFLAWGWRVPFLASAIMVVIGLVIRFKVAESPDFERMKRAGERERMPLVTVLAQHPGAVLLSAGAFIANNAIGYIVMAYLLSYGTTVLGLSRGLLLTCVLIGAVVWLGAIPRAS